MKDKVVLAYSGGLDTSVILKWLIEEKNLEVIAFAADLGQGAELDPVHKKAIKTGASQVFIEDLREEFVQEYIFPMFRANAIYEGNYLLGTSIARPLIAKKQIEIAEKVGAKYVSHGATGKGNDQVRFELTFAALNPNIKVIAPWREWKFKSRNDLIQYAKKHNIDIPVTVEKPYSSDRNLLHISFEGGILENPWAEPPKDMFLLSVDPTLAPDQPEYIEIEFKKGDPVAVNGASLSPAKLLEKLNEIGGRHGVGRVDIVENRFVGMKSRGVYETPGGTILYHAHRAAESITLERDLAHLKDTLITRYAELVYNGFWFSPEMEALNTFVAKSQENVNATVRIKIYKGNVIIVGRKSEDSLYMNELATFEEDVVYDQSDATGFIHLQALRLKVERARKQKQLHAGK